MHSHTTRRASDLNRHPTEVFHEAELHPVRLERRHGSPLVLMTAKADQERTELMRFAGMVVGAALDHDSLEEGLTCAFPWMFALSENDRRVCAKEIIDAARVAFTTKSQAHQALRVITAWRESAAAIAAGLVDCELE